MNLRRRIEKLEHLWLPEEEDESRGLFLWDEFCYFLKARELYENLPPGSNVVIPPAYRRLKKCWERWQKWQAAHPQAEDGAEPKGDPTG